MVLRIEGSCDKKILSFSGIDEIDITDAFISILPLGLCFCEVPVDSNKAVIAFGFKYNGGNTSADLTHCGESIGSLSQSILREIGKLVGFEDAKASILSSAFFDPCINSFLDILQNELILDDKFSELDSEK